eukprot:TRINITY_DN78120_c0_g1_i1.p1 TRINITY_DN78120_c0_g1~~TRINITY_DN78120_c0_g1_i1.p1  ORF type:complete len:293 (-),score=24.42 TRINITY_DN78120_c0_g1_i1:34-888(-)
MAEHDGAKSSMSALKMPEPPIIAAGALGGPFVIYGSTPIRNALTYAANDASLSIMQCYRASFTRGFLSGWTGGQFYAVAACPQFVCIGPVYHAYASVLGAPGAVLLTGITESLIVHGAEKKNGQLSFNMKGGSIPTSRIQNALNPVGAGLSIHIMRNVSAMIGMRLLCDPITRAYEKLLGAKSTAVTVAGDFSSNVVSACISMPLHQLWNKTISTPEMWEASPAERLRMMRRYLSEQYLVTTASGGSRISTVILRDAFLRSAYIASIYTVFVNIERAFVRHWPF